MASTIGPTTKPPVQRSRSIAVHSASPSERRTNTFVPPLTNVERFGMNVPMWKSGPEFKNT